MYFHFFLVLTGKHQLDVEVVGKQLSQEYKETRGKLKLLPGMPEECVRMEDLFVDLEIVGRNEHLESCSELVALKRYTRKSFGTIEKELVKRVLVRGNPGAGKSSAISKVAYDWACNKHDSPFSKYELLFAITINEIDNDTDLIGIIQDQLLPKVSRDALEDYIKSNASLICIIFDGYDEASKYFHKCKDIKSVLCSKWLAESCVIVTTRPGQVARFCDNYGAYDMQVEVKGFSKEGRKKYIDNFICFQQKNSDESGLVENESVSNGCGYDSDKNKKEDDLEFNGGFEDIKDSDDEDDDKSLRTANFLKDLTKSSRFQILSYIPIVLSMLCLIWVSDGKLPSSYTALFNEVILHLAKHRVDKKPKMYEDMSSIENWKESVLISVGKVAINGLFEDRLIFKASSFEINELEEACSLGIVITERKRFRLDVTNNVSFIHKTFQEACAAFYWVQLIETDLEKFKYYLKRICSETIFQMEYLLRFACGFSVKAAEIIIPHVLGILCEFQNNVFHREDFRSRGNHRQQFPLFLLYEAESNACDESGVDKLQCLLKPVYRSIVIDTSIENYGQNDEFVNVLDFYASPHYKRSQCDTWLAGVENVKVLTFHERDCRKSTFCGRKGMKLLCYMPKMTNFRFSHPSPYSLNASHDITPLLNDLLTHQFCSATISELHFKDISSDTDVLLEFLITLPSLAKLVIKNSDLCFDEIFQFPWPSLKELFIYNDFFRYRKASANECQSLGQPQSSINQGDNRTCIQLERVKIKIRFEENDDAMLMFLSVVKYMLHLQSLDLSDSYMGPDMYEKLFDRFCETVQQQLMCNHMDQSSLVSRATIPYSLQLEELDLSSTVVGDSIEKFVLAFQYMDRLKLLKMEKTGLKEHHCAVLFDCFSEVGRKKVNIEQERSNVTNISKVSYGLRLEQLDLSWNDIGDSLGKLAQAYKYMPNLKCLKLVYAKINSSQCAQLCDAIVEREKENEPCHSGSNASKPSYVTLDELSLAHNDISGSAEKLSKAITHMVHL